MDIVSKKMTRAELLRYGAVAGIGVTALPAFLAACGRGTSSPSASGSAVAAALANGSTIKLYAWQGYDDKDALALLKKNDNVTVSTTYIAGDQEVFTKLGAQKGIGAWDVLTYNSGLVPGLFEGGVLEAISLSSVPNSADIFPEFASLDFIKTGQGDTKIGLPFAWSYIGIVRSEKLPQIMSWNDLFDPAFKGKIATVNDPTTCVATACIAMGLTPYDKLTADQLDQAMGWWYKLKPNLRTILSDYGVAKDLMVRGEIDGTVPGWGAIVLWAAADGKTLYSDTPKEGVYGWMDLLCVVKGTKDVANSLGFVNFMLSPQAQADLARNTAFGITNEKAVPMLSQTLQDASQYANLAQNLKMSPIRPLPPLHPQDGYVGYVDWAKAWERFAAS